MSKESLEKMTAGEFLRHARQRSGKAQKEIAKELGLSHGAVSQWEMNDRKVPRERIHEVARSYGMTEAEEHELTELRSNPEIHFEI